MLIIIIYINIILYINKYVIVIGIISVLILGSTKKSQNLK